MKKYIRKTLDLIINNNYVGLGKSNIREINRIFIPRR